MTSIILVESNGDLKALKAKDLTVHSLYKKAGYRNPEQFEKRHTWQCKLDSGQEVCIALYAKTTGKATHENKYNFPPPVDNELYFGTVVLVQMDSTTDLNTILNLDITTWNAVYDKLFGGFELLGEEDEEEDEEEDNDEEDEDEDEEDVDEDDEDEDEDEEDDKEDDNVNEDNDEEDEEGNTQGGQKDRIAKKKRQQKKQLSVSASLVSSKKRKTYDDDDDEKQVESSSETEKEDVGCRRKSVAGKGKSRIKTTTKTKPVITTLMPMAMERLELEEEQYCYSDEN